MTDQRTKSASSIFLLLDGLASFPARMSCKAWQWVGLTSLDSKCHGDGTQAWKFHDRCCNFAAAMLPKGVGCV